MIGGTGGQLDFMIGSYYSPGGRGITLVSSARKLKYGKLASSIVPELPPFNACDRSPDLRAVRRGGVGDRRSEVQDGAGAGRGLDQHRPSGFEGRTARQPEEEILHEEVIGKTP